MLGALTQPHAWDADDGLDVGGMTRKCTRWRPLAPLHYNTGVRRVGPETLRVDNRAADGRTAKDESLHSKLTVAMNVIAGDKVAPLPAPIALR